MGNLRQGEVRDALNIVWSRPCPPTQPAGCLDACQRSLGLGTVIRTSSHWTHGQVLWLLWSHWDSGRQESDSSMLSRDSMLFFYMKRL